VVRFTAEFEMKKTNKSFIRILIFVTSIVMANAFGISMGIALASIRKAEDFLPWLGWIAGGILLIVCMVTLGSGVVMLWDALSEHSDED
jgi:hypothetical protein